MIHPNTPEVLEARIAPALIVQNPIPDIIVGAGYGEKSIELSQMFDPLLENPGHTVISFTLNFDSNPNQEGLQPSVIRIELFDDEAPLTVQNFLRYATDEENAAYIGTFLHRMFDFGTGSGAGMDIIQGGGFDVSDFDGTSDAEHIDTFSQVHNEFSRPNTAGTIAMAKTGLGPNTATSEWFININDNSSILGENNNSGFTVFGQVIQGMDVIQRLAQLPKVNLGGVYSDLPVQNYNADPDNNPSTPSPKPKPDNLITIEKIAVEAPEIGNDDGITYTVSVLEGNEAIFSQIVSPGENESVLRLIYDAAQNGVATVRVTATRGADTATDDFTVTLRPNLIGTVSEDSMGSILLPGEGGTVKVKIQNNGGANFDDNATIKFYLSSIDGQGGEDPLGSFVNDDDLLVRTIENQALSIDAAGEMELVLDGVTLAKLGLSNELIAGQTDDYRLIVQIVPADDAPDQLFTDDDVAIDGGVHVLTNSFGTIDFSSAGFGKRTNVTLKYLDPQTGKPVELSMKGPGTGQVILNEGDDATDDDDTAGLLITGTTAKSQLKIVDPDADPNPKVELPDSVTFATVEVTDFIGKIDFSAVDEIGSVSLSAGAKTVIFGNFNNVPGDTRLTIGGGPNMAGVTIKLGDVRDFSIESTQAIKSITALSWLDTRDASTLGGVDDKITASSISSIKIGGDFEANVTTSTDARLSTISIEGLIKNATIRSGGDLGKVTAGGLLNSSLIAAGELSNLSVTGTIEDLVIDSTGNIGKISAGEFLDSDVSTDATIDRFTVSGKVEDTSIEADGGINKFTARELLDAEILAGTLKNLSVAELVTNSTIRTTGDIGKVTVGGMVGSNLFAGTDSRPSALAEFDSVQTIKSITITNEAAGSFVNSQVAASVISKIVVRGINGDNEGGTFGFVADKVNKYTRVGGLTLSKLDEAGVKDTVGDDYQLVIL